MKLQELIGQTDLDMTLAQVKAFFLGSMTGLKPMDFHKAMEEMLSETPEAAKQLESELKNLWDELQKNKTAELQKMFPTSVNLNEYLTNAKDQLDFFLTALSLAGTNSETVKNEDLADLIDELEDTVMDIDDYLAEEAPDEEEGKELKELLVETWEDYLSTTKQSDSQSGHDKNI